MHFEFDLTNSRIRYQTGDHLGVYGTNPSLLIERIGLFYKYVASLAVPFHAPFLPHFMLFYIKSKIVARFIFQKIARFIPFIASFIPFIASFVGIFPSLAY